MARSFIPDFVLDVHFYLPSPRRNIVVPLIFSLALLLVSK